MTYPRILQTASAKFGAVPPSGKPGSTEVILKELAKGFPLSWSHYVRLLSVEKPRHARSTKPKPCGVDGPCAGRHPVLRTGSSLPPQGRHVRKGR